MSDYIPMTEDIRSAACEWLWSPEEFDRWFASEIEKAERRGQVLATARRIASENAELMRRLA